MNILYLANHLNTGGISSYLLTLAGGMKKLGHNVYLASGGGELLGRFERAGVKHIAIPIRTKSEISPKIIVSLLKLSREVKEKKIDIVHANSRTTQVLACLLKKKKALPYVFTCHGFFKTRLGRRIFPCWGDKVIAISEQVKEHLVSDFGLDEKNIALINNGIVIEKFLLPTSNFQLQAKKKLGLKDAPVVGIVARLSEVKGHIYLIRAMREVTERIPDAQLLIVGDGKIKGSLAGLAKELGIEKNVAFLHSTADTAGVLAAMDVFVMPSLQEGLGLGLMEAMGCALAVVGSDVGGIRTLVEHGQRGLLVKPADAAAIARAVLELLGDPDKRRYLGENARVFIAQNFSQEKMVLATERIYRQCLGLGQ